MTVKDKKEIISEILESLFGKEDNISFYFMKKVKNSSKNEAIIPYKTRKQVDLVKINELEKTLQKKTGEADLRLIRWSEVIGKIVPASRVFKIPFFDSRDIEIKAHPCRICPVPLSLRRRHRHRPWRARAFQPEEEGLGGVLQRQRGDGSSGSSG